ncbi:NYN domain protein [Pigmentiphaga humi]|uniref:NYN domain protein n=1 Tax=Pigmentiphaga humi TaxID=2478468 RepID=A0A3P4AYT8_9BURK|nr:NYN domain-containing protein [Pigmentiphaga humi]VCU69207.1 NYN domain protein [Pigmentiphaga humi]
MITTHDNVSMALFCDFENVALGVRDAKYERFDIKLVLERLLLKGSIVVKKAYCDWERYKGFKATMHEANFELIDIPHVRQSGKNSADIRLVVDALDLCYTKSHVNTFVIISGDSDFSPLVSKLRENAKQVIGLGVKQSTSDLLIANCDEFIFYDDLVRETQQAAKRDARAGHAGRRPQEEDKGRKEELESRRDKGIALAVETFDALVAERGDTGKIWASVLKEAIKRRRPDFNESYFGFRAFGNLLEAAQARGLLEFGRDDKSGAYVYRGNGTAEPPAVEAAVPKHSIPAAEVAEAAPLPTGPAAEEATAQPERRGGTRAPRKSASRRASPAKAVKSGNADETGRSAEPAEAPSREPIDVEHRPSAEQAAVPSANETVLETAQSLKKTGDKPAKKTAARKSTARHSRPRKASSASQAE